MSIKLLVFGTIVVFAFIVRIVSRFIRKTSQGSAINRLKKDPKLAAAYADGLDFPYTKKEIDKATFDLVRKKITTASSLGRYKILAAFDVSPSRILTFTELTFSDQSLTVRGTTEDTQEKAFHDFVLTFEPSTSELQVYSTMFGNAIDKFQKQEFINSLLSVEIE